MYGWAPKAEVLTGLKGDHPVHLDTDKRHGGYTIFSVLDDGQGFLWMATSRGICPSAATATEELAAQKRKTLDYVLLGKADGIAQRVSVSEKRSRTPPAQRNGTLWFATCQAWFIRIPMGGSSGRSPGGVNRCV